MSIQLITSDRIARFFQKLEPAFERAATLFLFGETSLVAEGLRRYSDRVEFCSSVDSRDRVRFNRAVVRVAEEMGLKVTDEYPGEVIPLPAGFEDRHRALSGKCRIKPATFDICHFDPYSVSYRFIARGSEPDYQVVLKYLENGWIEENEVTERLEHLLPEFSFETIQQDPAEFRRRMGGLWQMWNARKQRLQSRSIVA